MVWGSWHVHFAFWLRHSCIYWRASSWNSILSCQHASCPSGVYSHAQNNLSIKSIKKLLHNSVCRGMSSCTEVEVKTCGFRALCQEYRDHSESWARHAVRWGSESLEGFAIFASHVLADMMAWANDGIGTWSHIDTDCYSSECRFWDASPASPGFTFEFSSRRSGIFSTPRVSARWRLQTGAESNELADNDFTRRARWFVERHLTPTWLVFMEVSLHVHLKFCSLRCETTAVAFGLLLPLRSTVWILGNTVGDG